MNTNLTDPKTARFDREKLQRAIDSEYDQAVKIDTGSFIKRPPVRAGAAAEEKEAERGAAPVTGPRAGTLDADKRDEIVSELDRRLFSHAARLIFCLFALVLLAWVETAATLGYILPAYISLQSSPLRFLAADTALLLLCGVLCAAAVARGASALFTLKPCADSLAFVAFLGAVVNDAYQLFNAGGFVKGGTMIFSAAAAAVLTFNLLGQTAQLKRVKNGLLALPRHGEYYILKKIGLEGDAAEACGDGFSQALYPARADLDGDYLEKAFETTPADRAARVLSPVILAAAAVVMALSIVSGRSVYTAFASFAAACCIAAPVMTVLGAALPFLRASRRLRKRKAVLLGCGTLNELEGADCLIADAGMLFPPETVAVHAIKTFSDVKIEQAILDAASVAEAVDGPLRQALAGLISDDSLDALEKVEDIEYLDDLGICAVINMQQVLLGSRELMRSKGVDTPSRDFEAKYLAQGRDILYLSVGGRLSAMFIVGYYSSSPIISSLKRLERVELSLFVMTRDVNITPSLIAERLNDDRSRVHILGDRQASLLAREAAGKPGIGLAFSGSIRSCADAVIAGMRLRSTMLAVMAVQIVGAVLGLGLVAFCALTGSSNLITPVVVLEYQGIWLLPPLLIALLRRN